MPALPIPESLFPILDEQQIPLDTSACGRSNLGPRPEASNDSQHSIEAEWCIALSFFFNQIMTRIANSSSKDARNMGSLLRLRYAWFRRDH
jgi:hypothetical protein